MEFKALFIFSLLLSGCFIEAAPLRKRLAVAKKFLELLKEKVQAKGQEALETGKKAAEAAFGEMSPLVLLAMPVVAPAVLMQTVVLCSLFPYICIPVFTASSVVMGATLTKAATMKIKWILEDLRKDIEMLRESGLDLDNEFSTFALRKINEFRNALDAIIVKAVVETNKEE